MPYNYGAHKYWFEVVDERGYRITSGIKVYVFDANTQTLSTVYSDEFLTSKDNPISSSQFSTDEMVEFFSTAASHDVLVVNEAEGFSFKFEGVTPTKDHRLIMPKMDFSKRRWLKIPYGGSSYSGTTNVVAATRMILHNIFVEPTTATANAQIVVGTVGDTDVFASSVDVSGTNIVSATSAIQGTPIIRNASATIAVVCAGTENIAGNVWIEVSKLP